MNIYPLKDIELVFTRDEVQNTGPNFFWPYTNSRMRIQLKVEEVILILMMNENHLVVFLHCLAFNPRRLVLQAKFRGRLDNRFIDHLNRKFLRSSRLPQVLAGRYSQNVFRERLGKGEPDF